MAIAAAVSVQGASSTLGDFFAATAEVLPNKLALSLRQEFRYNDNVFEAISSRERGGWISETGATVDWYRSIGLGSYGLVGDLSYEHYHQFSNELSTVNYSLSPHLVLAGDAGLRNVMLSFHSTSEMTPIDNSETTDARTFTNGVKAGWEVLGNDKFGLLLAGDWRYVYYSQDDFEDHSNHRYDLSIAPYYKLSPKTNLGLRLGYAWVRYRNNLQHDDSEDAYLNAFINYRLSQKFSLMAAAGATRKEYDGVSSGSTGDEDLTMNYDLSLRYLPLANIALDLLLRHQAEDSFSNGARGMSENNSSNLAVTWLINPKTTLSQRLGCSFDDEKTTDLDTLEYDYDILLSYQWRKSIAVYTGYNYSITHFKYEHDLDYDAHEVRLGMTWNF
ncbi:MAG: hypothetical protein GX564_04235 [Oligosphaeraceae bacterium]|nr:hypothetical protein [Oligosphaeraceae bacterium]